MKRMMKWVMATMMAVTVSAQAFTITDNFSDNDYTSNPAWTVLSGSFDASGGSLKFGTGGGTAIALNFASTANTAMSASFKLNQMNGTAGNYTFNFILADTDSGLSYTEQAYCNPGAYGFPSSGFHSRNGSDQIIATSETAAYGRSLYEAYGDWPTVTMTFDPAAGVKFYFQTYQDAAPVLMAQWGNYKNMTKVNQLQLDNGNGVVTWYIDDVAVNYVPEPVTMMLLGLGGLSMLRRR